MSKTKRLYMLLIAAIVVITVVRLVLPYRIPAAEGATPDLGYEQNELGNEQLLEQIFAHNLWSQDRSPLNASEDSSSAKNQKTDDDSASESEIDSSWRLVGVSSTESEPFAVIESKEGVKNYIKGDLLPDGATLNEILAYGIQTTKLGKNERFYLFGKK